MMDAIERAQLREAQLAHAKHGAEAAARLGRLHSSVVWFDWDRTRASIQAAWRGGIVIE